MTERRFLDFDNYHGNYDLSNMEDTSVNQTEDDIEFEEISPPPSRSKQEFSHFSISISIFILFPQNNF
jgi:hypothetical protein